MASGNTPRYWREASTLILTGKCAEDDFESSYDYKVLLLQRNKKSNFAPGRYVFPGGVVDPEDFADEWKDIFNDVIGRRIADIAVDLSMKGPRAPIMDTDRGTAFPTEIGLRICAIRECFEESGLLLVRKSTSQFWPSNYARLFDGEIPRVTLEGYRKEVNRDAKMFRELCRKYNVVPDVWGLREWSNWLTPVMPGQTVSEPPKKPLRFDTIFYICALDKIPVAEQDNTEMIASTWVRPDFMFSKLSQGTNIQGPQLYEFSKMANFRFQHLLVIFFSQRAPLGLQRLMPVIFMCSDGALSLLPGDDLYPSKPDFEGHQPIKFVDQTAAQKMAASHHHHHIFYYRGGKIFIRCTIEPEFGQLTPLYTETAGQSSRL